MKTLALAGVATLLFAQAGTAKAAPEQLWTRSINTAALKGEAMYVGKCTPLLITQACPEAKPVSGTVSVGSTINGMKVGAILCTRYDQTIKGWSKWPEYAAFKGFYNCKAAPSKRAALASGNDQPRPWINMIGARF